MQSVYSKFFSSKNILFLHIFRYRKELAKFENLEAGSVIDDLHVESLIKIPSPVIRHGRGSAIETIVKKSTRQWRHTASHALSLSPQYEKMLLRPHTSRAAGAWPAKMLFLNYIHGAENKRKYFPRGKINQSNQVLMYEISVAESLGGSGSSNGNKPKNFIKKNYFILQFSNIFVSLGKKHT